MPAIEDFLADATRRMDKSIESTRQEFNSVRTGRASPALLDRVQVDYYGTPTPLKNLATISAPEPRLLNVQPFDPNSLKAIEKAIQESDLGLQPANDGKMIRLDPAADRGAAQGARQGRAALRRGRQGGDPQRAPGHHAPPRGARPQRRGRRRRGAARLEPGAE